MLFEKQCITITRCTIAIVSILFRMRTPFRNQIDEIDFLAMRILGKTFFQRDFNRVEKFLIYSSYNTLPK